MPLGRLASRIAHRLRPTKHSSELGYWYDRLAEEGVLRNDWYERAFTAHFELDPSFYAGKSVLDVGCGPRGSLEWCHMARERVGIDPLADRYQRLGADRHAMRYVASGAERIPFDDGCFDVVTTLNSLDHVDDVDAVIAELARVTRRGGTLLVTCEIGHEPTPTEPVSLGWDVLERFAGWRVDWTRRNGVDDKADLLGSIDADVPYESDPGLLRARLTRVQVRPQSGSRVDTVRAVQEQRLRIALFGQDGMPFTEFAAETAADIGEVVRFADGDPVEWLRSVEPDLLLSAGYGKLLPAEALQVPRIGAINVHPSLLPEYKGSYPVFWAFFDGRDELGITVHEMTPEFDSGAILAQDTLPIDPRDDPEAAYRGVITLGRQTLGRALQEIADTEIISGSPQLEEGCFRGVPWRELDRLQFDWALPASEIVRRQRIFTEYMHIVVRGERVFPRRVELVSARRGSPPGKVIGRGIDSVTVRAGDGGAVKLSGLRVRKDPRGETDRARSLLLGLRVPRHL